MTVSPDAPGRRLLTKDEAAEYLTISPSTLLRIEKLPRIRIGGSWRWDIADLNAFIEANKEQH